MDRSHAHCSATLHVVVAGLVVAMLLPASGCAPLLATGVYVFQGGNLVPPECDALPEQRVVVVCRPPSSHEYHDAGAARGISQQVSKLLVKNVKGIDVVDPREVDNWIDERDWEDVKELARAVRADKVVYIDMRDFGLYKGKTLYQGHTDIKLTVYDMTNKGRTEWESHLAEILYPANSGIPAQDKPEQQFRREFEALIGETIARNFYKHDPNSMFAMDALANR